MQKTAVGLMYIIKKIYAPRYVDRKNCEKYI